MNWVSTVAFTASVLWHDFCEVISKKYHNCRVEKYLRWFSYSLLWGNWINAVFLRRWVLRDDQWTLTSLPKEYNASLYLYSLKQAVTNVKGDHYDCLKYQICRLNIEVSEELYINVNSSLRIQIMWLHYHCHHLQTFLYYVRSTPCPVGPKPFEIYGKAV